MLHHFKATLLAFIALSASGLAEPRAVEFNPTKQSVHDIHNILGINKYGGTLKTDVPIKTLNLRISFFKDGKLIKSQNMGTGISSNNSHQQAEISVQLLDLDHLKIQGAEPNTYRIHYATEFTNDMSSSGHRDVSKSIFDGSGGLGSVAGAHFIGNDQIPNPILWLIASRNGKIVNTGELDSVIAENPGADIMVVHLELQE